MTLLMDKAYKLRKVFAAIDILESDKKAHRQAEADFTIRLLKIQELCPHEFDYIPDASGNNDGYDVCIYCGMVK